MQDRDRRTTGVLWLWVSILWIESLTGAGLPAAEEPDLREQIRQASAQRNTKLRTLRLEWTTRTRVSETLVKRKEQEERGSPPFLIVPADPQMAREEHERRSKPLVWKDQFTEHETETTLAWAGTRMRSETQGFVPHDTRTLAARHMIAAVDDKIVVIATIAQAGVPWPQIRIRPSGAPTRFPNYLVIDREPLRWLGLTGPLPLIGERSEGVEISRKKVQGRECVVLRQAQPHNGVLEAAYDPAMGFALIEETTSTFGSVGRRRECQYVFHEATQAWLPSGWTASRFFNDGLQELETATVRKCEVNVELGDDAFQVEHPIGSIVQDERSGAQGFDPQNKAAIFILRADGTQRFIPFADRSRRYDDLLKDR